MDVFCFDQGFEEFGRQVFGDVFKEVFHGGLIAGTARSYKFSGGVMQMLPD